MRPLIIGTGLPRTGTSSVRRAMEMLGYQVVAPCFEADVAADVYDQRLAGLAVRVENALDAGKRVFLSEPAWAFSPYELVTMFEGLLKQRWELRAKLPLDSVDIEHAGPPLALLYTWRHYAKWADSVKRYVRARATYDPTQAPPRPGLCDVNIALYASLHLGSILPDLLAVHARDEMRAGSMTNLGVPLAVLNVERPVPNEGGEVIANVRGQLGPLDRATLDDACRWGALLAATGSSAFKHGATVQGAFPHENRGAQ